MSNKSYKRYRQYRANRQQYKMDQIAFPIVVMLIIAFFTKYKTFILALVILFVIGKILNFLSYGRKGDADEIAPSEAPASNEPFVREIPSSKNHNRGGKTMETKSTLKSTEAGYINKNNQRNNGRSVERGTDHGQWFYHMECLNCGHTYFANGSDIWLRKCPKCQGGRP